MKKPYLALSAATLAGVLAACSPGASSSVSDVAYQQRNHAFKQILKSFEPMGEVVRGRDPYRQDAFQQQADALKLIAAEPFQHFPAGSISDQSRAKPEIWSQSAKFQADKDAFLKSVNELSAAAKTGDLAAIKPSYGLIAQNCKTCHDAFRGPEK